MKLLKTILTLIAFFAVMTPCVHAHEHDVEEHHATLSRAHCSHCTACVDAPCAKPKQVTPSSVMIDMEIPDHCVVLLTVLTTEEPLPIDDPCPAGDLQCLQTIQLLI